MSKEVGAGGRFDIFLDSAKECSIGPHSNTRTYMGPHFLAVLAPNCA